MDELIGFRPVGSEIEPTAARPIGQVGGETAQVPRLTAARRRTRLLVIDRPTVRGHRQIATGAWIEQTHRKQLAFHFAQSARRLVRFKIAHLEYQLRVIFAVCEKIFIFQ